jgi:hypothetical protein
LAEGEKAHPANYRGCKHAKKEMWKRKPQTTPKPTAGRVFSSNQVKPRLSFAAALRGQGRQPLQEEAPATSNSEPAATNHTLQKTGQSVQGPTVNNDSLYMVRAFSVVKQIMAERKDAASEEDKFVALPKIVFKLMQDNGK